MLINVLQCICFFSIPTLIMHLLSSCCPGLSLDTLSILSPMLLPAALATWALLSAASSATVSNCESNTNSSIRYLSDCVMDIMDHICMSQHWIVLSTANFRLQIFSQKQMSLRSSNFTFGATWLLRGRQNPFSCILCQFYLFIYLVNGLDLAHDRPFHPFFHIMSMTLIFLIKVSHVVSKERFFFFFFLLFSMGRKNNSLIPLW